MTYRYRSIAVNGRVVKEHIAIAEKILGKPLPKGAEVHHVDGDDRNNDPSNLVICPNHAYHMILHLRGKALRITGNPDSRPCHICKQWDVPENLYFRKSKPGQWHRKCGNILRKKRLKRSEQWQTN